MKRLIFVLALILCSPLFAETYTDTEFIVEGQPRTPQGVVTTVQPGVTTVTTTTYGGAPAPVIVQPGTTIVTTTATREAPIYVGMTKYHLAEVMGQPMAVDKFKKFAARKQGIYDEVWTYQTPPGVTYVYIKERRVEKIERR